jgi:hypothetical protein
MHHFSHATEVEMTAESVRPLYCHTRAFMIIGSQALSRIALHFGSHFKLMTPLQAPIIRPWSKMICYL